MEVFWRNGYSGTSLNELTSAMGINKPSLYAAFGNKEELFISALNQFVQKHGAPHINALFAKNKNSKKKIQRYLISIANMVANPKLPGGCFVTASTCEAGSDCLPSNALQAITNINQLTNNVLVDFFSTEKTQGNITSNRSAEELADYLLTLQYGLAVMARSGAKLSELKKVIGTAISIF